MLKLLTSAVPIENLVTDVVTIICVVYILYEARHIVCFAGTDNQVVEVVKVWFCSLASIKLLFTGLVSIGSTTVPGRSQVSHF